METVVSGVRPTGDLHLGNYFGALRNFAEMQHHHECYFFIADLHSLTTHPNPEHLKQHIKQVLATFLASGIDPDKSTLYIQSDLNEIPELYLLMNMIAYKGELERCTTFKEKAAKQENNINAGLLTYPVLMAVDIIIHKANKVPVGKDQEQHLEMTRNFANRFNRIYDCSIFPEPHAYSHQKELIKIPALDNTGKMGKSESEKGAIFLTDEPETIRKKVKRAVTDEGPGEDTSFKSEPIQNLFTLMHAVSSQETVSYFEESYKSGSIRYGDLKKQLAEDMVAFTTPIRERINEIMADDKLIAQISEKGADKARESAAQTLQEVKNAIGIQKLY